MLFGSLFIFSFCFAFSYLYNKWLLSAKYFNFQYPITLTMIHMGFCGVVAFFLIRVLKVFPPIKMTFKIYLTCVVPISAFFTMSLWFGNTAYLHISVAFIQMLKALTMLSSCYGFVAVATFLVAVLCGTDKLSLSEALRLVLTQILLQEKGLTLNPITTLYYIAPCSFLFLFVPWSFLEKPGLEVSHIQFNFWIFFLNAFCALALNISTYLAIGRTGAVTIRVAGVLKDWILIALSTFLFPESTITGLNIIGYSIALCGVVMYHYLKIMDVHASQLPPESIPDRTTDVKQEMQQGKKSSDIHKPNGRKTWNRSAPDLDKDEEAALIPSSKMSHFQ